MTLFILNETFTSGLNYNFLGIISLLSLVSGILVIVSKNPIVSVLFLIGLFMGVAIYLMMLGINFIGISYLLVYVGAVSILFLFILMLINVRISELVTNNNNSIPLAIMIGIIFILILYKSLHLTFIVFPSLYNPLNIVMNNINNIFYSVFENDLYYKNIFFVTSKIWDGLIAESSHITSVGYIIYTVYPLWLILTSVILLLAMVGAIVITIK
jgi:NADH-ubiquinone oxidoreductase chain 6